MKINKKNTALFGGSGAFVFNEKYVLGIFGYGEGKKKDSLNYGGIRLGYIHPTSSVIDPFINVSFGFGNISTRNKDYDSNTEDINKDSDFSNININTGIDLKMTKWFRISPYIGYISTTFDNNKAYKNDNYSGITYGVSFNFGRWGSKELE